MKWRAEWSGGADDERQLKNMLKMGDHEEVQIISENKDNMSYVRITPEGREMF